MSVIFDIEHTTHYRYARPVRFGEHTVLFRPRSSHDLRVLASDMVITPEPDGIRLIHDVYSNSVALVQPRSPADELKVVSTFTVEHTGTRALDLPLRHRAQIYPVEYSEEERFALGHYLQPFYDDPTGRLQDWGRQFVRPDGPTDSRDLLVVMTQHIKDQMSYQVRYEEGVQTPYQTLDLAQGTCRDFATLMIEAVRWLGYAARFVTGYIHTPWLDNGQALYVGAGATHAWAQVYLPGAGWIPFDPTNNLVGGTSLIRVGVSRHAGLAMPLRGSWHGVPGDCLGMQVDVQVRQRH
jgi:transglutaminase-like putative cysteine protease